MKPFLIAVAVIALIIAVTLISAYKNKIKLLNKLKCEYGKKPNRKYRESDYESIESYWNLKRKNEKPSFTIDATTWDDLDMDDVFVRINNTHSSIGEETLFAMLHEPVYEPEKLQEFENIVQCLSKDEETRLKLQYQLAKLGKVTGNGLPDFLYNPAEKRLRMSFVFPILGAMTAIFIVLTIISPRTFILLMIASMICNMIIYYKTKLMIDTELVSMNYIASLTACVHNITSIKCNGLKKQLDRLSSLNKPLKSLKHAAILGQNKQSDLDFLYEYIKMVFLLDFIVYNRVISAICRHTDAFREIYHIIGRLDSALSVASYRKSVKRYTTPVFTDDMEISLKGICHPLLKNPVSNTATLKRSLIITGSNASGKSTFVKSIAINAILAQTINTCIADEFRMKPSFVITSMAVRDSIEAGESYYIAEIKSIRRVINKLNDNVRCLCFIDEILKGTNTIERIAASASILNYLHNKNCFAVIATHDIELTEITGDYYDNYHFSEHITDDGIHFDYKIYEGRATTKNAIKLLEFMKYDPEITAKANELAENFEKNRVWEKF